MAAYSHWIEHIVGNMFPVLFGIFILRAPMSTTWVIFAVILVVTLGDHSGKQI